MVWAVVLCVLAVVALLYTVAAAVLFMRDRRVATLVPTLVGLVFTVGIAGGAWALTR